MTEEQIATLIDFAHAWGGDRPLVVNCYAARSRSSASLIIMMTALFPSHVRQIVEMVSTKAPHATPNRYMIALGDRLVGCDGLLIEVVAAMPERMRGFTGRAFLDVNKLMMNSGDSWASSTRG